MHLEPDHEKQQRNEMRRETQFNEKPLTGNLTRTSYQDSNPINNQNNTNGII